MECSGLTPFTIGNSGKCLVQINNWNNLNKTFIASVYYEQIGQQNKDYLSDLKKWKIMY